MEKILKILFGVVFIISIMVSCIYTTTVKEIEDVVNEHSDNSVETIETKTDKNDYKFGYIRFSIYHTADNIRLVLDSVDICNVLLLDGDQVKKGNHLLMRCDPNCNSFEKGSNIRCVDERMLVQQFDCWLPNELISETDKSYMRIHGKLYINNGDESEFLLYDGSMYTILQYGIKENMLFTVNTVLCDRCPWYIESNGEMEKVLVSINFDVSVDGWDEVES